MKKYRHILLGALFICAMMMNKSYSQKKPYLKSREEVEMHAASVLDEDQRNGDLFRLAKDHSIAGNYIYDITVGKNGKVITVFAVSRDGSIDGQNRIKDYLKDYRFDFKVPKGHTYKFQYQVTLK